jgi:hypothetical protein
MESEFVEIASYSVPAEAYLAKQSLATQGIHAVLPDEFVKTRGGRRSGLTLLVLPKDEVRAKEILSQLNEGVESRLAKGDSMPCLDCGGKATQVIWQPPTNRLAWFFTSLTHDMSRARLRCLSCGNEWDARW